MSQMSNENFYIYRAEKADIYKIHTILSSALRYRFNQQAGSAAVSFNSRVSTGNISISDTLLLEGRNEKLTREFFRLPGTRIEYQRFYNDSVQIDTFTLKEIRFIIFKKIHPQFDLSRFRLTHHPEQEMVDQTTILELPGDLDAPKMGPASFLVNLIQRERSVHPLNALVSQDRKWLDSFDDCWARADFFDYDGFPVWTDVTPDNDILAVLFHEWGVLFDTGNKRQSSNLEQEYTQVYNECVSFWNTASGQKTYDPQSIWNIFGQSIMQRKLQTLIFEKPAAALILYFDSLKTGTIWHQYLVKKIQNIFTDDTDSALGYLLKLLSMLHLELGIVRDTETLKIRPGYNQRLLILKTQQFQCRLQEKSFYFQFNNTEINLRINNTVKLDVDIAARKIELIPAMSNTTKMKTNTCSILANGYTISLPLVWRNFTFNFCALRFKFILKKKRFQVTVKGKKNQDKITVGNQELQFESSQYHRLYLPLPKNISSASLLFYDATGCESSAILPGKYKMSVFATDYRGLLQERIFIRAGDGKKLKAYEITSNGCLESIPITGQTEIIIGRHRAFATNGMKRIENTDMLKHLSAEMFMYQVNCYLHDLGNASRVQDIWQSNFGFPLQIFDMQDLSSSTAEFNLLIGDSTPEWSVQGEGLYCTDIIAPNKNVKKCIYINIEQLKNWIVGNLRKSMI